MQTNKISLNNSAYLTSYLCDDYRVDVAPAARPAVIICPGGGWMFLSEREGEPIAIEFARRGYMAFVLHYSVSDKNVEPGDFSLIYRALDEIETAYDHLMDLADDNIVDRRKIS
ncbi:MAG: alpha/beta hydrolase, partial [Lachnospiraceae bacterium]|nr:alpha/beta hydrolase [Lachnospiraceae bacterium]